MASPETAPSTPPPSSGGAAPASSNSTSSATPPPASPPPSPPTSPPPSQSSPPPASPPPTNQSPPPASPPLSSSPPPSSSSPPPSSPPPSSSPPPKDSPPPSPTPSPPASDSKSPPPTNSPPHGASPPPAAASSPPPPPATFTPPPPPGTPLPKFLPPPPGTISAPTPPSPAGTLAPPPPKRSPPAHHRSPPPPPSNSSSSSSNNTTTIIVAGVVLGGVVLLLALVIVFLLCTKKKKKQPYYIDTGRPPKPGDPYYNAATPSQWNSPLPVDHIVKLHPPPGVMGTPSPLAGGHWVAPPPPPVANTSSEFSSGYSGQHQVPIVAPPSPNMGGGLGGFSKSQFSYEELAAATGGFSQVNLLGQGGFGYVHKGVLPDGKEVAVKSLKSGSGQGEREFQAEVEIISRVHHRHLVSLVGYCIAGGQRMLVYEFVPNKTLEFHLHGKDQPVMDWTTRLRIALGSAKGLSYIHEDCHPRIIHRDIKAANILLDDKYEAMVADFGLAKLSSDNYTHVSTRVMGTFGYLAPEYASSGKLTEKSDVFSFGVMLLELITGRKPVDPTSKFMEDSLVDWARPLLNKALEDGYYDDLVDPRLEHNYAAHEMARMIACASASIRHSARRRPKMSQIVRALEGDSSLDDLNEAPKAANVGMGSGGSAETQTYDTGMYNADMTKFRNMVMSSQEFPSSEYGATSEYGLNPSTSSSDDFGHLGQQRKKP